MFYSLQTYSGPIVYEHKTRGLDTLVGVRFVPTAYGSRAES